MTLMTPIQPLSAAPPPGASSPVHDVPVDRLVLGSYRPRQRFAATPLEALARSMEGHGVLQPLVVRPLADGYYEIVAGERRYLAAQHLGLPSLPVTVRPLSEGAALEASLVENLQRENLNELEEAEGVLRLLALRLSCSAGEARSLLYRMDNEAKGKVTPQVLGSPQAQLVEDVFATVASLSWPSFVSARLPLLNLPPEVAQALRAGVVGAAGARVLGRVRDPARRTELLGEIWRGGLSDAELRRHVLAELGTPPPPLRARLNSWRAALFTGRTWQSRDRQARADALLRELAALLIAEEEDHDRTPS